MLPKARKNVMSTRKLGDHCHGDITIGDVCVGIGNGSFAVFHLGGDDCVLLTLLLWHVLHITN